MIGFALSSSEDDFDKLFHPIAIAFTSFYIVSVIIMLMRDCYFLVRLINSLTVHLICSECNNTLLLTMRAMRNETEIYRESRM